jgi:hypothetical protein
MRIEVRAIDKIDLAVHPNSQIAATWLLDLELTLRTTCFYRLPLNRFVFLLNLGLRLRTKDYKTYYE